MTTTSKMTYGINEGRRWAMLHEGFTAEALEERRTLIARNWDDDTAYFFWRGAMEKRREMMCAPYTWSTKS